METTDRTDQPGILNNGAVVLEYTEQKPAGNGWLRHGIAVCHRNDQRDPFVVWMIAQNSEGTWDASSGHYCTNIIDAVADYKERTGK